LRIPINLNSDSHFNLNTDSHQSDQSGAKRRGLSYYGDTLGDFVNPPYTFRIDSPFISILWAL
jgi:hypothetical protein